VSDPLNGEADGAATPLSAEEREGLIPAYITLRRELNEAEQIGIDDADRWAFSRKRDVLDERVLFRLHGRMFGAVWTWAGKRRTTVKNIGIDPLQIEIGLRQLIDDARYWTGHETFGPDEIAVRFHHRLTQIHPFQNGNGRFSRLAADMLAVQLGRGRFTWGQGTLTAIGALRKRYVDALHEADRNHDVRPLLEFARS